MFLILIFVLGISGIKATNEDRGECNENQRCILFSQCSSDNGFFFPCGRNRSLICCDKPKTAVEVRKSSPFPAECGLMYDASDKITGGEEAALGQFPWMALLGYKQKGVNYTQFLCGGTIVTEKYILTAAHCLNLDRRLELSLVRLGEHNLIKDPDCVELPGGKSCADKPVDYLINRVIPHPDYNTASQINDIALIRVEKKINFTNFIRPICMPVGKVIDMLNEKKLTISGWGKTKSSNLGGSTNLQFASVRLWDKEQCNKLLPEELRPPKDTQLCAHGEKDQDSCKGDSGGPLMNVTREDGEPRHFQIGIVSFGLSLSCGISLPTIYTRVDKYLDWITETVL